MNSFEDLQKVAGGKSILNGLALAYIKFFILIPAGLLLLYPPLFGFDGWGIAGGFAGFCMTMTGICAYQEIRFVLKGE